MTKDNQSLEIEHISSTEANADHRRAETGQAVRLLAALFDKVLDSQVALTQARSAGDGHGAAEALLRIRGTGLLLASIPAPSVDSLRPKVVVADLLRREEGDEGSYARRMVETAIELDMRRLQGPALTEMTIDD